MHEAHNVATGTAHIPDETFSAKEMDFFVPVLRINLHDFTHLAGRNDQIVEPRRPGMAITNAQAKLTWKSSAPAVSFMVTPMFGGRSSVGIS